MLVHAWEKQNRIVEGGVRLLPAVARRQGKLQLHRLEDVQREICEQQKVLKIKCIHRFRSNISKDSAK